MSGYFDRLAMRARGGPALSGLPLIAPEPALYRGDHGLRVTEEAGPPNEQVAPSPAIGGTRDAATPQALRVDQAGLVTEQEPVKEQPTTNVPEPGRAARPTKSPAAFERSALSKRIGTATRVVSAEVQSPAIRPSQPAPTEPVGSRERTERASPPVTLEQIVQLIDATPPASSQHATADPHRENPASANFPPDALPPTVSIGRIEIVVAPPVQRSAPQRSHGFQSYSRVRRGLDR